MEESVATLLPKFEQFIKERQYLHNVSPATVSWYTHNFKWMPSESPTEDELKAMVVRMREKGLRATGCNSAIRSINAYLKWSGSTLKIPQMKEPQLILPTYTGNQIQLLLAWKERGPESCGGIGLICHRRIVCCKAQLPSNSLNSTQRGELVPTFDVVLHTNVAMFSPNYQQLAATYPPVVDRVQAVSGLFIERLDLELAKAIMDTCEPKTLGVPAPVRQFAHMYAYVREVHAQSSAIGWDQDHRLSRLVGISRLIHPTSVGLRYAARVSQDNDSLRIVPAEIHGLSPDTFLSPNHKRDWLSQDEAKASVELDAKTEPLTQLQFPRRVSRALWYYDYAQKTFYADLRWTLIATALEALIHTGKSGPTRHFIQRVPALASDVGAPTLTTDECDAAYDYRSRLSHGDGFLSDMPSADIALYDKLEETLRMAILKAFMEPQFASIFLDDATIAARWKA